MLTFLITLEAVVRRYSEKIPNFIKKETLAEVFFCELCEISKNTFFTEHLRRRLLQLIITLH